MAGNRVTQRFGKDCDVKGKPCMYTADGCDTIICHDLSCCSNYTARSLSDIIYSIESLLINYSNKEYNFKKYGYHTNRKNILEDFENLYLYKEVLLRYKNSLLFGNFPCISCSSLQKIVEKVKKITGSECKPRDRKDIQKDSCNILTWNKANPYCISRDRWEELAYRVCSEIGLNIQSTQIVCQVYFELESNPIMCNVLYEISKYKQDCSIGYKLNLSEEQCAIYYNILSELKSCDLSFKQYSHLIDCNINPTMISTIYDCGMRIKISEENMECPILISLTGQQINICDIDFNAITDIASCNAIFN